MKSKIIREYIASQLQELKLGAVHSRNRLPKKRDQFKALFEYDGRIQAWIVTRGGLGIPDLRAQNFLKIPETFLVITFVGFNDETDTESLFEENLNIAYKMLAKDLTLGNNVASVNGISAPESPLVYIGEILSHYAEIVIEVTEYDD